MTVTGTAAITMSRGKILWRDGQLTPHEGWGRYVDRPCHSAASLSQSTRNTVTAPNPVIRTGVH
jgi:dihydropyrimidinase